ncbi:MAG: hypothetical protein QGH42_13695 [Kiritimatiellia bacterium]|jgi:predicted ATP-grasp superfamily ATP-dependent carboligase|nr:hypothetical protein [Kiritimatiellia bacterium]MDP6811165.1 hypothetical protein [Kiritimatiellia bacterium]MDP7025278.1 hypothetical protein [Kiritimatiellia bacterium]
MIVSRRTFLSLLHEPTALVLGCEGLTALGLIRSLGREGIPVLGVSFGARHPVSGYSTYSKVASWPAYDNGIIEALCEGDDDPDGRRVLFCATDAAIALVDAHAQSLARRWRIFRSGRFSMQHLLHKGNMSALAEEAGFDVPPIRSIRRDCDVDLIAAETQFPCILKPVDSLHGDKKDFRIIRDQRHMQAALNQALEANDEVLLQSFVEGEDTTVIEVFAFRSPSHSDTTHLVTAEKVRQYPPVIGSSSFIHTTPENDLREPIQRFLELTAFEGLVDFEFVRRHDRTYFIEANFRAGTPIALCQRAGYNLAAIAYLTVGGHPPHPRGMVQPAHYYLRDETDWRHVTEGRISLRTFIRDVRRTSEFLVFARDDRTPFWNYLARQCLRTPFAPIRRMVRTLGPQGHPCKS